ncbi:MAG: tetratricopeptide repeat protein [Alphaproteobacteria bacterium]
MTQLRNAVILAFLTALAGCATPVSPPVEPYPSSSSYGLYLAGKGALTDGRNQEAADYFSRAQLVSDDPEGLVGERVFASTLLAGDVTRAAAAAPIDLNGEGQKFGQIVQGVEALARGDAKVARQLLAPEKTPFPHKILSVLLSPWASAMAGDVQGSLVRPQSSGDKVVDFFGLLGQAHLFERAKRYDEAETDFKLLAGGETPSSLSALAYGGFLERRGRRADAATIYSKALGGQAFDPQLKAALQRAQSGRGRPPAVPTLKQGAAQAVMAPAIVISGAKQNQMALAYLRLALRLDPNLNSAWLMVGDLLQESGDREGARQAYGMAKPGSPEYLAAQSKLAWSYQAAHDPTTALAMAKALASKGDPDAKLTFSDILRSNGKYEESAQVLTEVMGPTPDWHLLYARGVCYDRAGRWAEGEADLLSALKQQPDDAEILNYLGYSWIDRGQHLDTALGMIQKAVGQSPRSGAIIDSLGWAYFRLGDFKKAVETLENAIELEAGDPDINNHLGDAYWRVGRKDEAIFQWRRVLTLDPDPKMKAEVDQKLAKGLPDIVVSPVPRVGG